MFLLKCYGYWLNVYYGYHRAGTWMRSGTPVLSMRLATLTVFPQMSYCGFLAPITPATTGPMFSPVENKHTHTHINSLSVSALVYRKLYREKQQNADLLTNLHLEVVERVLVDVLHLLS